MTARVGEVRTKPAYRGMDATGDPTAQIRAAIAQGYLMPNEHLVESDLASFFGTNRGVVRNVLAKLEQEGLVLREPNRGAYVRCILAQEAIGVLEIRCLIEALTARHAAQRAKPMDVARLRRLVRDMRHAYKIGDIASYLGINEQFHSTIIELSGHETAIRLLTSLKSQTKRFRGRSLIQAGRLTRSLQEHEAILAAIDRRDVPGAEAAMRRHLEASMAALRDHTDENAL